MGNIETQQNRPKSPRKSIFRPPTRSYHQQPNRFSGLPMTATRPSVLPPSTQSKHKPAPLRSPIHNLTHLVSHLQEHIEQNPQPQPPTPSNDSQTSQELRFNLQLHNQQAELEKYRKMVEHQLIKTHSIQSLRLQNTQEKHPTVVIKYNQPPLITRTEVSQKAQSHINATLIRQKEEYQSIYHECLQLYSQLHNKTQSLERLTERSKWAQQSSQSSQLSQMTPRDTVKVEKISGLFSEIQQLHLDQHSLQSQIKQAIVEKASSESDYV